MFRNGDEKYRGARILLPRKIMGSWEHVLELITQKTNLVTPVKRICTLDGRTIHSVSEFQDGGKYVALEGSKGFQRVSYCATDEKKLPLVRSIPRAAIRLRHKSEHLTGSEGEGELIDIRNAPFVSKKRHGALKRRKSIRPMAGRKNKEGREKAIKDHREDSIFGGSPPLERDLDKSFRVAKMPSPPLKSSLTTFHVAADVDKGEHPNHLESSQEEPLRESLPTLTQIQEVNESSSEPAGPVQVSADASNTEPVPLQTTTHTSKSEEGNPEYVAEKVQSDIFRAEGQAALEAETVPEGGETEVEKPIDQQEAEVVEELNGTEAGVETPVQQARDVHLEPQTAQTSVDLSLQRTTPKTTTALSVTEAATRNSRGPSKPPSVANSRGPSKPPSVANSRGPSKPPSVANSRGPSKPPSVANSRRVSNPPSVPNSRGSSKPPSRHSVDSQSSTSHTKPEDKSGEVEEEVEQAVEEVVPEEVQVSDSTPPTPPFNSPQEPPDVQEQLEEQLEDQT